MLTLLSASSNATGSANPLKTPDKRTSEIRTVYAYGTWDGATATVELSPDGGTTWVDSGISLTADGMTNLEARGDQIRAVLAGGGGSESVTVVLY